MCMCVPLCVCVCVCQYVSVRQLLLFFKFIGSQVSREVRINGNVLQKAKAARQKIVRYYVQIVVDSDT